MRNTEDDERVTTAKLAAFDEACAQRDAALNALALLVAHVSRVGGYMSPEDQASLRGARALLCETGRAKR